MPLHLELSRAIPIVARLRIPLFRLVRQKGVTENLKQPRLTLPASTTKGVNRRADIDLNEPAFFQHTPPTCARQATGNSVGPQVDTAKRRCGNILAVGDVGELQPSTWA